MSTKIVNASPILKVLKEGWADIDKFYNACLKGHAFGADFPKRALERAMKAEIRRLLRSKRIVREDGTPVKVASIFVTDPSREGRKRRVYKDETLFDVGDIVQVVQYWRDARKRCGQRIRYYVELGIEMHGPEIQGLLPAVGPGNLDD